MRDSVLQQYVREVHVSDPPEVWSPNVGTIVFCEAFVWGVFVYLLFVVWTVRPLPYRVDRAYMPDFEYLQDRPIAKRHLCRSIATPSSAFSERRPFISYLDVKWNLDF